MYSKKKTKNGSHRDHRGHGGKKYSVLSGYSVAKNKKRGLKNEKTSNL